MDREPEWRVLVTTAGRLYGTFKNFHIGKIPIVVAGPSPITNSCAARLHGDMGHCNCAACDFCGSRERLTLGEDACLCERRPAWHPRQSLTAGKHSVPPRSPMSISFGLRQDLVVMETRFPSRQRHSRA